MPSTFGQTRIDRGKYTIFLPDTILLKDLFRTYHFEHKNDTILYYEVWGGGEIDLTVIPISCIERENLRLDRIEVENSKGEVFSYYSTVVLIDDLTNKNCKCWSYEYPEEEEEEIVEEPMIEEEIFGIEKKRTWQKERAVINSKSIK